MSASYPVAATIVVLTLTGSAHAVGGCEQNVIGPNATPQHLKAEVLKRSPVKYFELASQIELVVKPADDGFLLPHADDRRGKISVVVPAEFPSALCRWVLAETVALDLPASSAVFDAPATEAGRCLDGGGSEVSCLSKYAEITGEAAELALSRRAATDREHLFATAGLLFRSALLQVIMHEYAHLFFDHFKRIRAGQLQRADAEFEADIFAVLNGTQEGEPASAMYYLFDPLAHLEVHAPALTPVNYESTTCRASNVNSVVGMAGLTPILLVDATTGPGHQSSLESLQSNSKEHFATQQLSLSEEACSRISAFPLEVAYRELHQLDARIGVDAEMLYAPIEKADPVKMGKLVSDLAVMSAHFRYMEGISAKCETGVIRTWGLTRPLTPLVRAAGGLLNTGDNGGNLVASDMGALLLLQGILILQEQAALPIDVRVSRSYTLLQKAVYYEPQLSEAWMNLAFIALKRGDCVQATTYAQRAVATHTGSSSDPGDGTNFFFQTMKASSEDPAKCASTAASFHPYPNW